MPDTTTELSLATLRHTGPQEPAPALTPAPHLSRETPDAPPPPRSPYLPGMSTPPQVTRGMQMLPSGGGSYVTSNVPSSLSLTEGRRGSGPEADEGESGVTVGMESATISGR